MKTLRKLLRLSPGEFTRLCYVSVLLVLAEMHVRLWPFRTILHALERRCARAQATSNRVATLLPDAVSRLTWLVDVADRHSLLRPSCLRRSLALAWLLSGRGVATALRIGVARANHQLLAHAWLEQDGRVVLDDPARVRSFGAVLSPTGCP